MSAVSQSLRAGRFGIRRKARAAWFMVAAVIVVVAALILWSFYADALPVDAAKVERGTVSQYVEERAKTRLPDVYRITVPVEGRVLANSLREGTRVHSGQIVAQMDTSDLEDAVAQAQKNVERIDAAIRQNNDITVETSMLEGSKISLEAMDHLVKAALETSKSREAQYQLARRERESVELLAQAAAINSQELDRARTAETTAQAEWQSSLLNWRAIEAIRSAFAITPVAIQQYINRKALQTDVLLKEMAAAQAVLSMRQRDLNRARHLCSPVDGVVLDRVISNERHVAAGEVLLVIGDMRDLQVEAEILSQEAVSISVGDQVEITGLSDTTGMTPNTLATSHQTSDSSVIEGTVKRIEPQAFTKISSLGVEEQRVRVWITLPHEILDKLSAPSTKDYGSIGVDYRVRVRIITASKDNVLRAPRSSIFRDTQAGHWQVFVVRSGKAQLTDVNVGLMNDDVVEITSGLSEGDEVIIAPSSSLMQGDRVDPQVRRE